MFLSNCSVTEQKETCDKIYDDLHFCIRKFGFNDIICRSTYPLLLQVRLLPDKVPSLRCKISKASLKMNYVRTK